MAIETNGEQPIGEAVDALFRESYEANVTMRIALAAHAIREFVYEFDDCKDEQRRSHEGVGSASRSDRSVYTMGYTAAFLPIGSAEEESPEQAESNGVDQILELFEDDDQDPLFSSLERARLAIQAKIEGVRTAHRLTYLQSRRAIALTRKQDR